MTARWLIRHAEVAGARRDVLVEDGRVRAVEVGLPADATDHVLDAGGGALIPGLHDHHAHLLSLAAARESLVVGPPMITDAASLAAAVKARDRALPAGEWMRCTAYHESVAGTLDRSVLDRLVPDRPIRIQHRSGAMWMLNSAALRRLRLDDAPAGVECDERGEPTGRMFGLDAWLRDQLAPAVPDVAGAVAELNGYGVTGVTDATPIETPAELRPVADALHAGLRLRVVATGAAALAKADFTPLARGPVKIVLADHALPGLADVASQMRAARDANRPVAVHSVTLESLLLALAAWDEVGAARGDRLEHGAVIPESQIARIEGLRLTVVTQPNFVAERGDEYLSTVDPRDVPNLFRCRSLLDGGVRVALGTDAPFGDPDPWKAIAAASTRRTPSGRVLGPGERIDARRALARFLSDPHDPGGPPRHVQVGMPADLCLLRAPLSRVLRSPSADQVAATIFAGTP